MVKKKPALTIHKNTKQQRESKQVRKDLIHASKDLAKLSYIKGYAIIVWDEDYTARAEWCSNNLPGTLVPEFIKQVTTRVIHNMDVNDIIDYRFN